MIGENEEDCVSEGSDHQMGVYAEGSAARAISCYLLVTATCRLALPSSMTSMTSSGLDTNRSVAPCKCHKEPLIFVLYK